MTTLTCIGCTSVFAVGLRWCPQCGSMKAVETGSPEAEMAKITKHGGPSDATQVDGGEDLSPGNNSSTSGESTADSDEKTKSGSLDPVPTTESPYVPARAGPGTASRTGGSTRGTKPSRRGAR